MSLLRLTTHFWSLFFDQAVVPSTCREHVPAFLVIQTREEDTSNVEALLQTVQWVDINFSANAQPLTVLSNLLEMRDRWRGTLVYVAPLKQRFELRKGFVWCVCRTGQDNEERLESQLDSPRKSKRCSSSRLVAETPATDRSSDLIFCHV